MAETAVTCAPVTKSTKAPTKISKNWFELVTEVKRDINAHSTMAVLVNMT